MKVEQDAVAQDRNGKRGDVVVRDVVAAARKCACFRRQHNELRGPNAAAVVNIFLHEVWRAVVLVSRRAHQVDDVPRHRFAYRNHADKVLEVEQLLGGGHGLNFGDARGRGQVHDFQFVAGTEVVEDGVEEEAVQLGLGQRVGTFEFDGVLCCQHEEGCGQRINVTPHRAGAFLHGFK